MRDAATAQRVWSRTIALRIVNSFRAHAMSATFVGFPAALSRSTGATATAPRPETSKGMPHAQIGVTPDPVVDRELRRRAYALPGVLDRPTVISVPGARALWLADDVELLRPDAILRGREFAHIHPDGSLHATLHPQRAREAGDAGWAEPHPIAEHLGLPGLVMLYTPRTMEELDIVFGLIVDSYNFVTGRSLDAAASAA